MTRNNLIFAADYTDIEFIKDVINQNKSYLSMIKLGLEFFYKHGVKGVQEISTTGVPIFLDLKLHDIPNTVERTLTNLQRDLPNQVKVITVHAQRDLPLLKAARKAVKDSDIEIAGVTVLTSLISKEKDIVRTAKLCERAGLNYVVASYKYVTTIKEHTKLKVIVPGFRFEGQGAVDQRNVFNLSALRYIDVDYIVLGRCLCYEYVNNMLECINRNILKIHSGLEDFRTSY